MLHEKIIDLATGEETIKEYTTEQLAEAKKAQDKADALIALQAQAEAAKKSAQAKLEALGLTTDDLVALGL